MTATIDPMHVAAAGCYADDGVVVVREHGPLRADLGADGRVCVRHDLDAVDDDLAEALAEVLAPLTDEHAVFGSAFTGIVLTSGPASTPAEPVEAWERFYVASLVRLTDPDHHGYVDVYRHAIDLLPDGGVLDLGCGFGFLALHLARHERHVLAADVDGNALHLLRTMAGRLGLAVDTVADSAACTDRSVDAVTVLHVLEHVSAGVAAQVVAEAVRIARRRVVVAVPYEDVPTALYGHLRRITGTDLRELGAASGLIVDVHDHHGGWLVIDRPPGPTTTDAPPSDRPSGPAAPLRRRGS